MLGALGMLVRLRLGSPVFFRQERIGKDDQTFVLFKLRTMTDARDEHGNLLEDKDRMTPLGMFLRSASLDELPQLWNIVRGEMSFVGPRPLLVHYLPRYSARQRLRHRMRPGITGWAQVNGRNLLSWEERLEMDVRYVENFSLLLDAILLFKTVGAVLGRRGVSSKGSVTMTEFQGEPGTPASGSDAPEEDH